MTVKKHALPLLLLIVLLFPPAAASSAPLDWPVSGSQFYTQTAGEGSNGYFVSDGADVPFLKELKGRGGPSALGYPISRRFTWKGFTVQAFQKAVLQWQPGENKVFFLNVFDDLGQAGRNDWLKSVRSTPDPDWLENEDKLSWDEVVKGRTAFLDANPAIKARYFSVKDPISLYGLPSSRVEDMGNHFAIRLQRAVIQQWKVDVPWAKAGETTVANGGDIAKEAGIFPAEVFVPTSADPVNAAILMAGPVPAGTPIPGAPAPVRAGPVVPIGLVAPTPAPSTTPIGVGLPPGATATPTPNEVPAAIFTQPPVVQLPRPGAAKKVVIDPGHGGNQVGAASSLPGQPVLQEKMAVLELAKRTTQILRDAGYEVLLTRETDVNVGGPTLNDDLQARIDKANAWKPDVFISIHLNGYPDRNQRGTEVFYALDRPFSNDNRILAELIYQQIGRHLNAAGYAPNPRGFRPDTTSVDQVHLFLLSPASDRVKRPTLMPASLGEALFLTNEQDAAQIQRPEIREAISRAYAAAVALFLQGRQPWKY